MRQAYFIWATFFVVAVAGLLLGSTDPQAIRMFGDTVQSFLTVSVLVVAALAFGCEYIDSTLGMGYGTTLTPVLLLMGYEPLHIVPAVLLSELLTGITSATLHHGAGNVSFRRGSRDRKVAGVLAACSVVGTLVAVAISVRIPKWALTTYIGVLVLVVGIVILATLNKQFGFSWKKIVGLGLIAAFNKGVSGGGYGPVVTGGQLVSGLDPKSAVGITSAAEGLTCVVGVVCYLVTTGIDCRLALPLVLGAMASVPVSVMSVKMVPTSKLRVGIGILTVILGLVTLRKVIL